MIVKQDEIIKRYNKLLEQATDALKSGDLERMKMRIKQASDIIDNAEDRPPKLK